MVPKKSPNHHNLQKTAQSVYIASDFKVDLLVWCTGVKVEGRRDVSAQPVSTSGIYMHSEEFKVLELCDNLGEIYGFKQGTADNVDHDALLVCWKDLGIGTF